MTAPHAWPWVGILLLGAAHGINPGMGWLFAVALGLQHRARRRVWGALLPLAAGHAAAIALAVGVAAALGTALPARPLRWLVSATLLMVGVAKLVRQRHPRYGGMAVRPRQVACWSFLMASAHGAGLMAIPFLLALRPAHATDGHTVHVAALAHGSSSVSSGVALTLVHTAGYVIVTGAIAAVVYERLGLRLLGRVWFNVDRMWAVALILTAAMTPLVA